MLHLSRQSDHSPSSLKEASPRTPPRNSLDEPRVLHRQNGTATPNFSPLASPSMSLPSFSMSPLTPSRRQASPPFMGSSSSPSPRSRATQLSQDDFAPDGKITLIQRLTDLAMKINQGHCPEDERVNKLHAMMDQMESVFSNHTQRRDAQLGISESPGPVPGKGNVGEEDREPQTPEKAMYGGPDPPLVKPSPSAKESQGANDDGDNETQPGRLATEISGADAERIVAEAQHLCKGLEDLITSLKARQEESDHIHDLLIMRAERAAQHIMYLEKRVQELENERNENEMEILNLQFQLKAIEVQCLSYVPKDADQDLRESISAWKTEWSALKRKRARMQDGADAAVVAASGSPHRHHARTIGSPGTPSRRRPAPKSPGKEEG